MDFRRAFITLQFKLAMLLKINTRLNEAICASVDKRLVCVDLGDLMYFTQSFNTKLMFPVSLFLLLDRAQKHRCEEQTNK